MATRADQLARRERILGHWAAAWPAEHIATMEDCSPSNVHRIVREYGDPDHPNRTERNCEMKRAEKHYGSIVIMYNEGSSIDQISKSLGLMAREVRAGVYLGIQRGEITAFLPGVVAPESEDAEEANDPAQEHGDEECGSDKARTASRANDLAKAQRDQDIVHASQANGLKADVRAED